VPVRFYVDADLLGVAKVLVTVRSDVTYPGDEGGVGPDGRSRPPCPIRPGDKDPVWIPQVAGSGWVIISRDRHMRNRPAEQAAILEHRARVVVLDAHRELSKWGQLEIIVCQWRGIEELHGLPGPWVYVASRGGLRRQRLVR
jgi:hypothetical protein